ncbi:MAG TPA: cupin domain-containing protein [Acidimicrobiales bacterium]|nr:cupin domain-containing protein [Acidimicrobiales bacterium]
MKIRRVVTGHTPEGKSVFVADEDVEPITNPLIPGAEFHRLWGGDQAPTFPGPGTPPDQPTYFPAVGGYRFGFFSLPPGDRVEMPADVDVPAALAQLDRTLPGLVAHMEPDNPGMHTTDTIDFEVVLSGRVTLELDDGAEKTMNPGDTVVQNGTRHRWKNPGGDPAVIAVFMVGAHRTADR